MTVAATVKLPLYKISKAKLKSSAYLECGGLTPHFSFTVYHPKRNEAPSSRRAPN
jgi:hypothetical protein